MCKCVVGVHVKLIREIIVHNTIIFVVIIIVVRYIGFNLIDCIICMCIIFGTVPSRAFVRWDNCAGIRIVQWFHQARDSLF